MADLPEYTVVVHHRIRKVNGFERRLRGDGVASYPITTVLVKVDGWWRDVSDCGASYESDEEMRKACPGADVVAIPTSLFHLNRIALLVEAMES